MWEVKQDRHELEISDGCGKRFILDPSDAGKVIAGLLQEFDRVSRLYDLRADSRVCDVLALFGWERDENDDDERESALTVDERNR